MQKIKMVWDIYGVLLELKERFDKNEDLQKEFWTLEKYSKAQIQKLCDIAFEWIVDDETEMNQRDLD